jgi:hypothetical protein
MQVNPFNFSLSRMDGLSAGALLAVWHQRELLHKFRRQLLVFAGLSAIAI